MSIRAAFAKAASVPREGDHSSGTLDEAEAILNAHPALTEADIYTAALLGDSASIGRFVSEDPAAASRKGGPYNWDPLTYLCFSRFLRLDRSRSEQFERAARVLLQAGASANTGWYEEIDHPRPRWILESAIYGAAGVARNAGVTRVLLEFGADPNDEETPYHVPEGDDNEVMRILLESGRLDAKSLSLMAVRKADWHDAAGLALVLRHGADPKAALRHAIKRDNSLEMVRLLLDAGAPEDAEVAALAASRGRADVLQVLRQRAWAELNGVDSLIAKCAWGERIDHAPEGMRERGGALLAEFAGNGNVDGVKALLAGGIPASALYQGDPYFDIAPGSTALHVAAWRAHPKVVAALIEAGAPVNAEDGKGRTALQLAVKACVDSYWTRRRSPESVRLLLAAGATVDGIALPCGYEPVDALLSATAI